MYFTPEYYRWQKRLFTMDQAQQSYGLLRVHRLVLAITFSLIQTAMQNKLDPDRYLTWLLKEASNADLTDEKTVNRLRFHSRYSADSFPWEPQGILPGDISERLKIAQ